MPDPFLAPALVALRGEVDARSPGRSKASDGWIGDPAHAARKSDHNPDATGRVDAIDLTHDPANGADCNLLADQIKDDPRVSYIIWDHRIWNPSISRTWRPYTGSNPHDKHMHVSADDDGANDTQPWLEKEQGLMPDEVNELKAFIAAKHLKRKEAEVRIMRRLRTVLEQNGATHAQLDEIDADIKALEDED